MEMVWGSGLLFPGPGAALGVPPHVPCAQRLPAGTEPRLQTHGRVLQASAARVRAGRGEGANSRGLDRSHIYFSSEATGGGGEINFKKRALPFPKGKINISAGESPVKPGPERGPACGALPALLPSPTGACSRGFSFTRSHSSAASYAAARSIFRGTLPDMKPVLGRRTRVGSAHVKPGRPTGAAARCRSASSRGEERGSGGEYPRCLRHSGQGPLRSGRVLPGFGDARPVKGLPAASPGAAPLPEPFWELTWMLLCFQNLHFPSHPSLRFGRRCIPVATGRLLWTAMQLGRGRAHRDPRPPGSVPPAARLERGRLLPLVLLLPFSPTFIRSHLLTQK